jgi:hypothetical protein
MWQRALQAFISLFSAYKMTVTPVQFLVTVIVTFLVPYAAYLLFGSIAILILAIIGTIATFRWVYKKATNSR